MRIIDSHIHFDRMRGMDIQTISIAGVEAGVLPTPHLLPWMVDADTLFRMWRNFINFHVNHGKSLGIEVFVTLGVPFYGLTTEAVKECLKELPKFLENERVVGLGEIGLDAGIEDEVKIFRTQLNIAKEHNLPVIVHTPTPMEPQAPTVLKQIINVMEEEHFPLNRAVLDHTGRNTLKTRLASGCMVGLSLCYDKLRPEDAAEIIQEFPDKRSQFTINSEFGYSGEGYYSVPRAVLAMRKMGFSQEVMSGVVWENPKKFFDLPLK